VERNIGNERRFGNWRSGKIHIRRVVTLVMTAMFTMSFLALIVRGATGEATLPPRLVGQAAQGYRAAQYTLQTEDEIDYSFSATGEVTFYVMYRPDVSGPAPIMPILWMVNVSSGLGVFKADWGGIYFFKFRNENTTTTVTVSYSIQPHESWWVLWVLVLAFMAAAVTVLVVGIAVIRMHKKKGV